MRQKGRSRPSSKQRRKGKSSRDGVGLSLRQAELNAVSQNADCARKDTSKGGIKSWRATPQCTTLMWNFSCFPVQGHLSETQKVEFFQNILKQFHREIFFVMQQHNMARYGTLFFKHPSRKSNYFILSFNSFSSKHYTTTLHRLCGAGVCGGREGRGWVNGIQMSRWQETTPNGEVQTGIRSWCDLMITLKVSPLTSDTSWQSLPSKSKLILVLPKKSSEGMNERVFFCPLFCVWDLSGLVSERNARLGFTQGLLLMGRLFCAPPSTLEDQLRHCCEFERHLFEGRRLTNDTRVQAPTQNIEQRGLQFHYLWMNSGAMWGSVMPVEISSQPQDKETGRKDRF